MRDHRRNVGLCDVIAEAGCTYEALARMVIRVAAENGDRVLTNRSAITHWISGTKPTGRMPAYLAEALTRKTGRPVAVAELGFASLPGQDGVVPSPFGPDSIGSLSDLGRADLDRRLDRRSVLFSAAILPLSAAWLAEADERGQWSGELGGQVGQAEVDTVRAITEAFNRADETLGGGHGRAAVVQYLVTDVAAFCSARFSDDETRRAMFGAAAELAYLAGWKAHDIGAEGLAQQYYARSLQLAKESDPRGHAAWCGRILAHQALDLGRPNECVALATRAWDLVRGHVDPATEALFSITAARAHAAAGHPRPALRALLRAEDSLASGRDEDMPHWASLTGHAAATVTSNAGKTFAALGNHACAEERFSAAAAVRGSEGFRRAGALNLAQVADAQAAQGHADQACDSWSTALTYMRGISSDRHRKAVTNARQHLHTFKRRGVPGAALLDQRCVELLASS